MFSARLTDIDTPCDRMRELELIASIQAFQAVASTRAQNASASQTPSARVVRIGIGDDCAVLRPPHGHDLVVTTDLLLETTHFRRDWHSPEAVGYRCLARGLSDLAAMGAQPVSAFLSFAVPARLSHTWIGRFLQGLLNLAHAAKVPLAGGDTAQAPGGRSALFTADILLLGSVPRSRALLRSGARPGDKIYVTGQLGGAAAELAAIAARPALYHRLVPGYAELRSPPPLSTHPHLFPALRLRQGARLRALATAALDLSDGLSTDIAHLCKASGVRAVLRADLLPIHPLALATKHPLQLGLHGGEDYELLFTARAETRIPRSIVGVPVTCIGHITARRADQPTVTLLRDGPDGRAVKEALEPGGWQHFSSMPVPGKAGR
jgi:thiamine-monophosphate kinase